MTQPKAPSFETTATYVADTVHLLGQPQQATEKHEFSIYDDRGSETNYAHTTLDIPLRPDWEDLKVRRYGTRTLKVVLLGETITMDAWNEIPPVIGISSSAQFDFENRTASPVLGVLWYHFNTKQLIESGSVVFREGYHSGIQEDEDVPDVVFDMFELPQRSRASTPHLYLADIIEAGSLVDGYSEIRTKSTIDLAAQAAGIARETKRPVPKSLSRTPRICYETRDALRLKGHPSMSSGVVTIEQFESGAHTTTTLRQVAYQGFEPAPYTQEEHFFYGKYVGEDGLPLGIGIDLRQRLETDDFVKNIEPENDTEARRMVQPLIQSMANLRRYAKSAYPKDN